MTRRIYIAALLAVAVLLAGATAPALARTKPHCRHGYAAKRVKVAKRVHRHGRWVVVRKHGKVVRIVVWRCKRQPARPGTVQPPPATTPTPVAKATYTAGVDPTFTQSPADPLQVTYSVSADATETLNGVTTNLATIGQLPDGILNFYSQGQLECSLNVGGSNDGGPCTVTYPATGTYTVVTEYVPNGVSAVESTETETISPFATTTTIATSIGALSAGPYGYQFAIGLSGATYDPYGAILNANRELMYTITDTTTGQIVGYVAEPGGRSCALTFIFESGTSAGAFQDDSCDLFYGPDMEEYAEPYLPNGVLVVPNASDTFALSATYPGSPGYAPSVSAPWPA